MCVTVLFGDDREELFNLDCQLIHFVHNLKQRCGLGPAELCSDSVDLMDGGGTVMRLEGREYSLDRASSLLRDRRSYILVKVCRGADGECKYIPLLNRCQSHPELTEVLRKLSTDQKQKKRQTRRGRRNDPPRPRSKN